MIKNEIKKKKENEQSTGLSWGVKLVIINAGFVLMILGLVYYSTTVDVNLVTDNYYEKELKYQDQIDKINRSNGLAEQIIIEHDQDFIRLKFPSLGENTNFGGYITCYRPSDHRMDIKVPVSLTESLEQVIPLAGLEKGLWKIKADWYFGDVTYFNEKPILID